MGQCVCVVFGGAVVQEWRDRDVPVRPSITLFDPHLAAGADRQHRFLLDVTLSLATDPSSKV